MTTATDWDVTDTETGEHPVVTDVTSAATDAPVLTAEHALILRQHNTELAGKVGTLSADVLNLRAENRRLQAELDRRGWLPTAEQMRDAEMLPIGSAADLTERERMAALTTPITELFAVDSEGMPLTPIAADSMWPTWLGDVHRADATLVEQVGGLRSWADSYAARPVERTVVEPVAVDYGYRQTEAALYAAMVVSAAEEHVASVYGPEYGGHIYDADRGFVPAKDSGEPSPPDDGWNRDAAFDGVKRHQPAAVAAVRADAPPTEPPAELEVHPEAASSVGGWRTWAASVALGVSAFGTLGSLLWLAGVL